MLDAAAYTENFPHSKTVHPGVTLASSYVINLKCIPLSASEHVFNWPVLTRTETVLQHVPYRSPKFRLKTFLFNQAPCRLRGCKNRPAPFPGRMSYKATKPGLVSVLYLSMFIIVLVFIRAPFYVLLVFIVCVLSFGCSSSVVITCQVIGKKDPCEQ